MKITSATIKGYRAPPNAMKKPTEKTIRDVCLAHKLPSHRFTIEKQPRELWGEDAFILYYCVPQHWRENDDGGQNAYLNPTDREVAHRVEAEVLALGRASCDTEVFGNNHFTDFQIYVGPKPLSKK